MASDRRFSRTAVAIAAVVLFAFFVRTYWNIEAATPGSGTPDGTFVLSESDAYFHHHSVERVQNEGWKHPIREPLVNYPVGGINPNPPLFTWWMATWGALTSPILGSPDAGNHPTACPANIQPSQATCVSTWWVTVGSPALFGALTVLLIILIGAEMWSWRAGLFAGFLLATSTSHIERSVLGFADHDAFVLFFIALTFLFFIKALQRATEHRWVQHWGEGASVRSGLATYVRANQLSLAYATMAGIALAGVGLAWKGYAYAAGIMLVYGVAQVLINHWRQRDSTHVFATVGVALLVGVLLSAPYYANPALGAVFDTLMPLVFILLAWILLGIVFTAARDLPFVLVLPGAFVAGLITLVVAFVVAPSVAQSLLAPLVYFKQTKLYTTIAEAHPADFNTVVFGTGLVGFFVAVFALPYLVWVNRKTWRPSWTFVAVWGVVAIFMTHSAVRFMFNATPVFALLGGWGLALLVGRLDFAAISKQLRGLSQGSGTGPLAAFVALDYLLAILGIVGLILAAGGDLLTGGVLVLVALAYYGLRAYSGARFFEAVRKVNRPSHIVGGVLIATLLLAPNVLLSVDAGMPASHEDKLVRRELASKGLPVNQQNIESTFIGQRFGAFGQGFISDYWRELFEWLSTKDTDLPEARRPAFLSWWDYGHWALSLGRHPAVADNFQNGFQFAGNFIAAQNETNAVQLMLARLLDQARFGGASEAALVQALQQGGIPAGEAQQVYRQLLPTTPSGLSPCPPQGRPEGCANYGYAPSLDLQESLAALKAVEAQTGQRIRYFAVDVRLFPFDNPQTRDIDFGSIFYAPIVLSDHNPDDYVQAVIRASVPGERKSEFTTEEWQAIQRDVRRSALIDPNTVFQLYKYKEPFFNSMFYQAYIGTPVGLASIPATSCEKPAATYPVEGDSLPGVALPGFCMEHFRVVYHAREVRMLQFYHGAVVQGSVQVDGKPLAGARVVAYDDAGDLLFPENNELLTDQFKQRFQAQRGRAIDARDFDVPHDEATTDAQGNYRLVVPFSTTGQVTIRAFKDQAEVGNRTLTVTVQQAETGHVFDGAMGTITAQSGSVTGRVYFDADRNRAFGEGDAALQGAQVTLDGDRATQATTDDQGRFTIQGVTPGRHQVLATAQDHEMSLRLEESAIQVNPGAEATYDVPMELAPAAVGAAVWRDANADAQRGEGEGVQGVNVKAIPDFRAANTGAQQSAFSRDNGTVLFEASPGKYVLRGEWVDPADGEGYAFGSLLEVARGQAEVEVNATATQLVKATPASVNLTLQRDGGNISAAQGATVLFIPTQGGLPAAERAPANGTLTIRLVPGTYQVFAEATDAGVKYRMATPLTLTVVEGVPASGEGRLTRA
jgi:asparagine N-glycosylation enzyme membrane subunit Stt3